MADRRLFPTTAPAGTLQALPRPSIATMPRASTQQRFRCSASDRGSRLRATTSLAQRLTRGACCAATVRWTRSAGRLVDAATTRTHALGATLFRDLVEGESFASLHDLAMALARGGDAVGTARELASIGHSSGVDMLAGFLVGVAGSAVLPREQAR